MILALATLSLPPLSYGEVDTQLSSQSFQPRSGPQGDTLFTEMPADHTGIRIENAYDDPRMWRERYHEFGVGAIGTGLAIGDFDQDGLADLFVVSKIESCRLYRNLGNWKFEDVTMQAGVGDDSGDWKQGAAFVDVDNDGWLDIYLTRFAAPNLLFVNQKDGTFREEAEARGLAIVDASGVAAFEDYDRDGWLDLYLQTNLLDAVGMPNGQPDYLFHNNGDGTFTDVTEAAGIHRITQGHSATWWDYNEDGWPDIYVANDFAMPDFLYSNNRDGTFTDRIDEVVPHMPYSSMGSDTADINNDGHFDFLVADMANASHEKDQRGMADSRSKSSEHQPTSPTIAEQIARNSLYLNTGLGRVLETAFLSGVDATNWTWSLRFEDLDNDGLQDLHVTNGMNREQNNVDLIHGLFRSESAMRRVRLMYSAPVLEEPNYAFRNVGDARFEKVGSEWGLDQFGVSFGAAFGDLDNDGDLDLAYTNYQNIPTVLRNDSPAGNTTTIALRGAASNSHGVGAVVEIESALGKQTRRLTLARGYLSTSQPILHFGLGSDDAIHRLTVRWPSGHRQTFTDLAANSAYTVTEPEGDPAHETPTPASQPLFAEVSAKLGLALTAQEEFLEGTVSQPLLSLRFNRRGPGLAIADLDGDDIEEIIFGGTTEQAARVLKQSADGSYQSVPQPALQKPPVNDGPPLAFDANGDGHADLLLTAGGAVYPAEEPEYEPRLYLNDGKGALRPAPRGSLPSAPNSAGAAAVADFDRDGKLDVFIGGRVAPGFYPETPFSTLLHNRGGRFADATDSLAPDLREVGMVTAALWSDVDLDGWPDLLLALDWGHIRYFRNLKGKGFQDLTAETGFAAAGTGWWTSLAAADFNQDGTPDFVAGNLGLNTQFRASPVRPETLLYHDFAKRGAPQLVHAYYEGDRLLPRASRRELAAKIPAVLERFPKNNDFAKATLAEILTPEALAKATHLEATEFHSGIFLSQSDGTYQFAALPTAAQTAPLQGIAIADFDADGSLDIVATQNSYAPIPSIGRFDGGLGIYLQGDGQGNFTTLPAEKSGLLIPGDAKALIALDLNNDARPDLLATRNNTTSQAFLNQSPPQQAPEK
ncbi:FG-GAP repeat domain protein [Verrucomicrobiia bacterium DG1235]|nr:FG-GAP repeat domain protein [Verrucomicrobiae bacterium DG1235]